jgi:hypothetical protein
MLLQISKKNQTLSVTSYGPLKFLSILHKTHSNSFLLELEYYTAVFTLDAFQSSPIGWPQFGAFI